MWRMVCLWAGVLRHGQAKQGEHAVLTCFCSSNHVTWADINMISPDTAAVYGSFGKPRAATDYSVRMFGFYHVQPNQSLSCFAFLSFV